MTTSEEEFITEHYRGYSKLSNNKTSSYHVLHPIWEVHNVKQYELHSNNERLYGANFAETMQQKPTSVFMASGSEVTVLEREIWKY